MSRALLGCRRGKRCLRRELGYRSGSVSLGSGSRGRSCCRDVGNRIGRLEGVLVLG